MTARDILTIGSKDKPPVLFPKDFKIWKDRFLDYVERQENGFYIYKSLTEGTLGVVYRNDPDGNEVVVEPRDYAGEELLRYKADKAARSLVMQALTNSLYQKVDSFSDTGKGMFDELIKLYQGSEVENQMKISNVFHSYENFKQKDGESLDNAYDRFTTILNDLNRYKVSKSIIETNVKFLSVLQPEWRKYAHRMRQTAKLEELPLQQMFETLKQDEDDVDRKRKKMFKKEKKEKKKESSTRKYEDEEEDMDGESLALVSSKQSDKGKRVLDEEFALEQEDLDEAESLKQAMLLLSKAFTKKFVKPQGSNNLRYSSGSKNFEHKSKFEAKKPRDDSREDQKRQTDEDQKCYNCGKPGHFSKECWKPKVRDSAYYKRKALLAEKKESGIALLVEEEYWLDLTDDEGENETAALANMCLMSKDGADRRTEAVPETEEVNSCTVNHFANEFQLLISKQTELTEKLTKAYTTIASQRKVITDFNKSSEDVKLEKAEIERSRAYFRERLDEMENKMRMSEKRKLELEQLLESYKDINIELSEKASDLEAKLYKLGQSEQTVFLNKPKNFRYYNSKWGLGYDNPHYLENALKKAPCLYKFEWLKLPTIRPKFKINWLDEEEQGKEEELKRKTTVSIQIPFCYDFANASAFKENWKNTLSDDYFRSYRVDKPEEDTSKPVFKAKTYYPPLVLEQKIIDLESNIKSKIDEIRNDDQLAFDIQKDVILTVLMKSNKPEKNLSTLSSKASEERKSLELRCLSLSKQVADFQKMLFLEKKQIEKERESFYIERKTLEDSLIKEQENCQTNKEYFTKEISNLMGKLSTLSTKAMTEFANKHSSDSDTLSCKAQTGESLKRNMTVDFFDDFGPIEIETQTVSESQEETFQNPFSNECKPDSVLNTTCERKGKEALDTPIQIDFNAKLPDHSAFLVTEETPKQNFCNGESSKKVEKKKKKKKNKRKNGSAQARNSNAYNSYSNSISDRDLSNKKKDWRIKASTHDVAQRKSTAPILNSKKNNFVSNVHNRVASSKQTFAVPRKIYSMQHMIDLAHDQICCSYCGADDFICKSSYSSWFGYNTHHSNHYSNGNHANHSSKPKSKRKTKRKSNPTGPKQIWVPKVV